ncbi:hypothetical protein ASF72_19245 [Arthrobacter sp. Leaf141]|nr:hypothetical protein ASF72_19245 [Arthrobacter sp. Leaf141]
MSGKNLRVDLAGLLVGASENCVVIIKAEDILVHVPMTKFMSGRVPLQRCGACTVNEHPAGVSRKDSTKQTFQGPKAELQSGIFDRCERVDRF